MATKKLTEPQEVCPVCGRKFTYCKTLNFWGCIADEKTHNFPGPDPDPHGRGIDRIVRTIRRRMTKEAR